jgi:hypothetical protein
MLNSILAAGCLLFGMFLWLYSIHTFHKRPDENQAAELILAWPMFIFFVVLSFGLLLQLGISDEISKHVPKFIGEVLSKTSTLVILLIIGAVAFTLPITMLLRISKQSIKVFSCLVIGSIVMAYNFKGFVGVTAAVFLSGLGYVIGYPKGFFRKKERMGITVTEQRESSSDLGH